MVNPIPGGSQGIPNVTPLGSGGSGSLHQINDTLSNLGLSGTTSLIILSADNPQIPKPSLLAVMNQVSDASVTNKQKVYEQSVTIHSLTAKFYQQMIFNADNLLKTLFDTLANQAQAQALVIQANNEIQAQNVAGGFYNLDVGNDVGFTTNINSAATTFNAAYDLFQQQTVLYNNGQITQAQYDLDVAAFNLSQVVYNSAVAIYDNYQGVRNTNIQIYNNSVDTYNSHVGGYNTLIQGINSTRASLGLPPLPLLSPLAHAPLLPQANTSPPAPVTVPEIIVPLPFAPISTIPTVFSVNLLVALFLPLILLRLFLMGQMQTGLNLINNAQEFVDFYLRVKTDVNALPAAFASQLAASSTNPSGTSSNTGLAAMSGALDPVIVRRLFNQGFQNAVYKDLIDALTPGTLEATLLANALTFSTLSTNTAAQLIKTVPGSILEDKLASEKAFSLNYVNNLVGLLSNNVFGPGLASFAAPAEENTPTTVAALTALQSTVNLSVAGLSLGLLSLATGLPGIGGQILGNAGLDSSQLFNLTNGGGIGFNNFLSNPFLQPLLSSQLATSISQTNPGLNISSQDLSQAILQAAQQTSALSSGDQFLSNLSNTLTNQGIKGKPAVIVLSAASSALFEPVFDSRIGFRENILQSLIQQDFDSQSALQIASSIAQVSPLATSDQAINVKDINTSLLAGNLTANLVNANVDNASDIVNKIIDSLVANRKEIAEQTLRDDLAKSLVNEGLTAQQARRIATGVSIPVSTLNNPLLSSQALNTMSQAELHAELVNTFTNAYGPTFGNGARGEALKLANALVDEANPTSLVNITRDNLNQLKNLDDKKYYNAAIDNFKDYIKPSVEFYAFIKRYQDPGNAILFTNDLIHAPAPKTGPVKIGGTNPPLEISV